MGSDDVVSREDDAVVIIYCTKGYVEGAVVGSDSPCGTVTEHLAGSAEGLFLGNGGLCPAGV